VTLEIMPKRKLTLRLDAELIDAVRAAIGPEGFMNEVMAEALQLWLASKRAGSVPGAVYEPPALPWNAYRPPRSTQA
jgi:hypothetical protein